MALNREQLLAQRNKRRMEEVPVPEWGGSVFVRELSAADRDAFETSSLLLGRKGEVKGTNLVNMRARLAVLTICDEDGQRLFGEEDVVALGEMSASALQRVFEMAQRLSGFTDKDMEELEKNSVSGPSGVSSSS